MVEEDRAPRGVSGSLMRALSPFTASPVRPQPLPATPPPGTNALALEFQHTAFGSTNVQTMAGVLEAPWLGCSAAFPPLVSGWDFTVCRGFPRVCLSATVRKDEEEGPCSQIRTPRPPVKFMSLPKVMQLRSAFPWPPTCHRII